MADDSSLLCALKAGDSSALAELFESYADRIYRLALGSLQNPAEAGDVVQETFIKAISNIDKFEGRANLGTWLYRVAYNASMDRLRRRPEAQLPSDEPDFSSPDSVPMPEVLVEWDTPEDEVISTEDRQALDEAIQQLPDTLRNSK
jgi:RNA polymerase sigma-70 factor (ECF subfamily)